MYGTLLAALLPSRGIGPSLDALLRTPQRFGWLSAGNRNRSQASSLLGLLPIGDLLVRLRTSLHCLML